MKKSKGFLALILALMVMVSSLMIVGAQNEFPTLNPEADMESAPVAETDKEYSIALLKQGESYIKIESKENDGYYTLSLKNDNLPDSGNVILTEICDNEGKSMTDSIRVRPAEEMSTSARLAGNKDYYVKLDNYDNEEVDGNCATISINYASDPEPDEEKSTKLQVKPGVFYEGTLYSESDEDWIYFIPYDKKQYRVVIESRNPEDNPAEFQAMVYHRRNYLEDEYLSHGETSDFLLLDIPAENQCYYVNVRASSEFEGVVHYAVKLEDVSTVTPENDTTLDSIKFVSNFTNSKYDNTYLYVAPVIFGKKCVTEIIEGTYPTSTRCVKIATEELNGEFEFKIKNESIPTDGGLLSVRVLEGSSDSDDVLLDTTLALGEEQTFTLEFMKNHFYYISFYTLDESTRPGGLVKFSVTQKTEPEVTGTTEVAETTETTETIVATEVTEVTEVTTVPASFGITEPSETTETSEATTVTWTTEPTLATELTETTEITEIPTSAPAEETKATLTTTQPETSTATEPAEKLVLGDTDLNGKINIKDATLIQKALAKITSLGEIMNKTADVTGDSKVNIKDATAIQKFIAKIPLDFKIGEYIM